MLGKKNKNEFIINTIKVNIIQICFIYKKNYILQYEKAIELCKNKNVPMTEELAETLTPTKGSN